MQQKEAILPRESQILSREKFEDHPMSPAIYTQELEKLVFRQSARAFALPKCQFFKFFRYTLIYTIMSNIHKI